MKVMKVQVKLFATFRNGRQGSQEFEYPQDIPISTVLKDLSLTKDDVGMTLVNGIRATKDIKLHNHDVMALVPEYKPRHH
jgi:sulfur carrier protein